MDWVKIVYSVILLVCGILTFVVSYYQKGDERRKFIHAKAQSYSFIVVICALVLEVAESIYLTIQGNASYNGNGISPIMFLTLILIIYLVTLLIYRKKYGD
jgi:magnesium-transporting ATPase (P-type)